MQTFNQQNLALHAKSKKTEKTIPDNLIFAVSSILKEIKGQNFLNINSNEKINFDRNDIAAAISCFKKEDKNWNYNTSALLILNDLVKNYNWENNSDYHLSLKFAALSFSYERDKQSKGVTKSYELLKGLALKYAYDYSKEFYSNLKNAYELKNKKIENIFISSQYELVKGNNKTYWNISRNVFSIYSQELATLTSNQNNFINFSKIGILIAEYNLLKLEAETFLKNKKNDGVVNSENYNNFSSTMILILDSLKSSLYFMKDHLIEKMFSNITEMNVKVHLSDLPPMSPVEWIGLIIRYVVLILWALVIIFPIVILIQQGFNLNNQKVILDIQNFEFSFNNYRRLFEQTLFLKWLLNSIIIGFFTMIITIFIISLTAYSFSRFKYKGKRSFLIALLVSQMVPVFTSLLVFYIFTELLNNAFNMPRIATLLLIYVGGGVASNTIILKGYMDSISQDIDDAARIDGCSHFWIFLNIIFPLCKPMLVLIALMSFIGPFGDVILPSLILRNQEDYTVAVGLNMFINSERLMNYGAYFAGSTLVAVPIGVLFLVLQKFVVSGMTSGGVKG
ncbi:maltose ABC transporter permease [Spiroplasma sabaudiense Ar-1343]|uniref:Maltose ABC transporter permease n=1 Tax=Spiroplasma sabaudiense Ar-1343 TaxID=1276257 RepID=W6AB89_9MOLU|nr:sugar ABC transporter permease [Spiroplasma sabaudiense]AHI54251.1 maltose ABC transporter permease [Spiroplasma sabaudiense Ar-1343]